MVVCLASSPLVVAVSADPPFAMREADGTWSGLSVDLWREVAEQLGQPFELREVAGDDVDKLLSAGAVDAAIGAIAIDAESEKLHDFSQPYYATGLSFAERTRGQLTPVAMMDALGSRQFLRLIGFIVAATVLVGILIAFIERRREASEFGGPLGQGIATGVWWAAVTMTTVGYGDATPKTTPGRSLALLWMFVGVVAVALFTATVTSLLTLGALHGTIQRPADLLAVRLGAVPGGPGAHYLDRRHVKYVPFNTYEDALAAVAAGQVDAVLANSPALRHLVSKQWQGTLRVSPIVLEPLSYAVGLPSDSPLREQIDRAVLDTVEQDRWRKVEDRYLGRN